MKRPFEPKYRLESAQPPTMILELMASSDKPSCSSPIPRPRSLSVDSMESSSSSSYSSPSSTFCTPPRAGKVSRKVRFDRTASVVLIPTIEEYKEVNLHEKLWYADKELKLIERSAIVKISTGKLFDDSDDFWSFIPHIDE